jgi:hypothetical protein
LRQWSTHAAFVAHYQQIHIAAPVSSRFT